MNELEPGPKLLVRNLGNFLSVQRPIRSVGASLATARFLICAPSTSSLRDREWLAAP